MAKLLVISAHPLTADTSRSLKILEVFLNVYKENNKTDTIDVLHLYDTHLPEINEDLLRGWAELKNGGAFTSLSASQQKEIARFNELTEQFLDADKVVIANALWNLNVPTRLKAWIDTINVAGKTFAYTDAGPVGLVKNKKALHIQSNGGVYGGTDLSSKYVKEILEFVGIQEVEQLFIEGIDHQPEAEQSIMDEAIEKATVLGTHF